MLIYPRPSTTNLITTTGWAYFGDLSQLPPVKPPIPVYHHYVNRESVHIVSKDTNGEHIWHEALNRVIILDKNFRQQDPAFLKICQAVRKGEVNQNHMNVLNSRLINKDNMPPADALYIYATNDQVTAANIIMTHRHAQANGLPVIRLLANIHPVKKKGVRATYAHQTATLIRDESHRVFSGFTAGKATTTNKRIGVLSILDLHLGAPVILCNVSNALQVSYNISNNSTGTFIGFWPPTCNQHFTGKRSVTLVGDNTSGTVYYPAEGHEVTHLLIKMNTHGGKEFQMPGLPPNVYAMARTKGNIKCQDGHHHMVEQFRIRLFYSSTCDKVQGQSIDRAVVLGGMNNQRGNYLYVVLTRVHRLMQLYIAKALTRKDMNFCGPDVLLANEIKRLKRLEKRTIHLINTCPRIGNA